MMASSSRSILFFSAMLPPLRNDVGMIPDSAAKQSYRPDIDGLRAVAILSVLLFHAFPETFPGGFIGVDIFFVISGYLISGIIFRRMDAGNFSFLEFYIHRVRRIFPALGVVLAATFAFGWISLFSEEYKLLGAHLAASVGFVENFLLYSQRGYFDVATDLKPLMHLWSLAIEEQFYLFFPPMVLLLWRAGRRFLLIAIIAIAAASFAANLVWTRSDPTGAFFFPMARAWELMAGAILAHFELFRSQWPLASAARAHAAVRPGFLTSLIMSGGGLVGLLFLVMFWGRDWAFPGTAALLPIVFSLGALISGRYLSQQGNILNFRPFVAIGLISYPLYLWHWPILSYLHLLKGAGDSFAFRAWGCFASLILAWATFEFVERPLRYGGNPKIKAIALCFSIFLAGVLSPMRIFGAASRFGRLNADLSPSRATTRNWIVRISGSHAG